MSDTEAGQALITAYRDAVGALDVDAVAPLFTEDGRVIIPHAPEGIPPSIEGREAVDAYYRGLPDMATPSTTGSTRWSPMGSSSPSTPRTRP